MQNDRTTPSAEPDLQSITDQIEEGVRSGRYTWREIQEELVLRTREAAASTDVYVHENPWRVVGLAAGFGFILGLLLAPDSGD